MLGGNTNNPRRDSGRGMYTVIFDRSLLGSPSGKVVSQQEVMAAMKSADPEVLNQFFRVVHLVDPPLALVKPKLLSKVFLSGSQNNGLQRTHPLPDGTAKQT